MLESWLKDCEDAVGGVFFILFYCLTHIFYIAYKLLFNSFTFMLAQLGFYYAFAQLVMMFLPLRN
jgi:hypothetical protein